MLRDKRKTPLQYWQADGVAWPLLQDIAIKLFAMAKSSAASEWNFSTFGFIHSKLRNSLATEKVQKLVIIKTNYRAFADTLVEYSDNEFSSDHENEEVEINETK
jgi:hypothetical protein